MNPSPLPPHHLDALPQREALAYSLYRLMIALLITALLFSPWTEVIGIPHQAELARPVALIYLTIAVWLTLRSQRWRFLEMGAFWGGLIDITAVTITLHSLPSAGTGLAMSLLVNLTVAALLLRLLPAMLLAVLAGAGLLLEHALRMVEGRDASTPVELGLFITSYLALAWFGYQQGARARQNRVLAEQRGAEVANLYEINELIIRRLRTGVLVVDADDRITLANEAAIVLLGEAAPSDNGSLPRLPPPLAVRLHRWRQGFDHELGPMRIAKGQIEVQPRFARLLADSDQALVFLDDTTVISRRAESLTLSAMGRFSASLAHEIRNPLAAINYATQLLEESPAIGAADRRLLQIIHQQCQRTNGIIESVLGLARRERAIPENIELNAFVRRFVEEYQTTMALEANSLDYVLTSGQATALADPRHLHQVLSTLVHNALHHGRSGNEPARVRLRVGVMERHAVIDCLDRGPGLAPALAEQLFRPFFTTSEHGTGLGLYIARELCRANQGQLEHVPMPAGGACFRITLPGAASITSH
ncbi:ATPase [Stenotrophomonas ginsengisoli]|uniref:histidine kinase n=1 Tax=Stenotrophomonas ginsengisoli TaxID=336566 RepID=A0A0R0D6E8_9GAMM|nr:ATP-binding protein [Stenotrophomonas ginsengisoli]KRG73815.1 ATPase [Stenotrophomonas ginsengisoli]